MDSESDTRHPLATLLVLNDLRPVAGRLPAGIEGLRSMDSELLADELARHGSVVVYRGSPDRARVLEAALRQAGLTTSRNTLVPDLREGRR